MVKTQSVILRYFGCDMNYQKQIADLSIQNIKRLQNFQFPEFSNKFSKPYQYPEKDCCGASDRFCLFRFVKTVRLVRRERPAVRGFL